MGFIETTVENLLKDLSTSIRKFTAFIFLVFAAGVIAGTYVIGKGEPAMMQLIYIVPLLLALASYFFTEIAIAFFFLFLIVLVVL